MRQPQHQAAYCNNGFSLIELMVAILIIMISMLALLTAIATSMSANVGNDARNVSIKVTNETAEALLALPIDDPELTTSALHTDTFSGTQQVKGLPNPVQSVRMYKITYGITWNVTSPTANLKQINITVTHTLKGQTYTNASVIYKHRAI